MSAPAQAIVLCIGYVFIVLLAVSTLVLGVPVGVAITVYFSLLVLLGALVGRRARSRRLTAVGVGLTVGYLLAFLAFVALNWLGVSLEFRKEIDARSFLAFLGGLRGREIGLMCAAWALTLVAALAGLTAGTLAAR